MYVEYPEDIKETMEIFKAYENNIKDAELKDAPPEAIEAFYKFKKWAWEQGQ